MAQRRQCPFRWLGLWASDDAPSLATSLATALLSTFVLVGLWPALRELGLQLSIFTLMPIPQYSWDNAWQSMTEAFSSRSYWLRLWKWELWSLGRWWLLFGVITVIWLLVSAPFRGWLNVERPSQTIARFLAFAPWLVALEIAFLIGVWIESPLTVPEPSTGFVAGIFSWDLWHWDCWLDRGWIIRGATPTFVAGSVFLTHVLRWRRPAALVAGLALVPLALMLSVACTVAYQHGLPPLW